MSRLAIISFHNLHLIQFLYKYTVILDEHGISYDVLYWNRDDIDYGKKFMGNAICFNYPTSNYWSKRKKINGFLKCRSFFKKQIKQNDYDQLILLTTQTAVALFDVVLTKYKGNYIYDYRDITFEKYGIYAKIVKKLNANSFFTAISSEGFAWQIGNMGKLVMSHNCNQIICQTRYISEHNPIRLVFWGMIRQLEFQKQICDYFGGDERFQLVYHGEGGNQELAQYCAKYSNIIFTGRYFPEQIQEFAMNTDILMNLYENDGKQEFALTVKLYDGIRYGIPMLVTKDSYMQQYIGNQSFAYPFAFKKKEKDAIIKWVRELNLNQVQAEFEHMASKIKDDEKQFEISLLKFAKKEMEPW